MRPRDARWTNKWKNEWVCGHAKNRLVCKCLVLYLCEVLRFTAFAIKNTVFKIHPVIYQNLPVLQGIFFLLLWRGRQQFPPKFR